MSRRTLTTFLSAAVLAFGTPLMAQDPKPNSEGARPNPGGSSQGSAVARPSGGGGGGSSSGEGTSSSAGAAGGRSGADSSVRLPGNTDFAPQRPERRAVPRGSSSQDRSGDRPNARPATPRNGDDQRRVAPGGNATASSADASSERRRAVPTYARPRDGRPAVGTAVERRGRPVVVAPGSSYYYYDPYYRYSNYYSRYPYGYYYAGYGLGLGYFYDPLMWGYYSPYGYGGDPYYSGGGYSREGYRDLGGLRLKVKPAQGQVYVDGYYVGEVDSFDGIFQKLQVEAGAHRVEIRADGYETVQFEVMVTPGETVTYKGDMKRIQ